MTDGKLRCGKCGANAVPMGNNKGFRCGRPGNQFVRGEWTLCDWAQWNKSTLFSRVPEIPRASGWPTFKAGTAPTAEQQAIRDFMGRSPASRGGRMLIVDAGPGTGKTFTLSWACEVLYHRFGNLSGYPFLAFNTNARDVLQTNLPALVPDVATLNGWGGRSQGYSRRNYDAGKALKAFKALVAPLPKKERPHFGKLGKVLERSRDLCLWADAGDRGAWQGIINTVFARFPSLAKKCKGQEATIAEYLPLVAHQCLAERGKIDIQEQVTRPSTVALAASGLRIPLELSTKRASEWTDADVQLAARIIRTITLPQVVGMVVDEAQDLSLAQLFAVLAQCWRTGELTIIGDDQQGKPGDVANGGIYKAGQGIYGWRGAFGGVFDLAARLWNALTGEDAVRLTLTVTFRHSEEVCACYRPLNSVITSARPDGYSSGWTVGPQAAFEAWLSLPEGATGLYITRTNAALASWFLSTIEAHEECSIRGGGDFQGSVDTALYESAGWYDDKGEYSTDLPTAMANLAAIVAEQKDDGGEGDPNSLEGFVLRIAEAVTRDGNLLRKAGITDGRLTVGNVRRFILHFADKNARRVCTTVYRCKGDEADLAIVGDTVKFNETWGDSVEDNACRHVALSRAKRMLLVVGHVIGSAAPVPSDDDDLCEMAEEMGQRSA